MLSRFVLCLLVFNSSLSAQSGVFQGQVDYLHLFRFKESHVDSLRVLKGYGTSSKYITKEGSYKWTFKGAELSEEYYFSNTGKTYNRYNGNDTLFMSKGSDGDTLLRYEIYPNADTICGYVCDRIRVLIGKTNNKESLLMRQISFARDLPVNPEHFRQFDAYCNYEIFKITRSFPLRIEMDTPYWPFSMCFYATKVDHRPVSEKELELPTAVITTAK